MLITSIIKRFILKRWAAFLFLGFAPVVVQAQASETSAADGYAPNFDGNVYALATQPDGKVVVGGQFGNFRDRAGFTHRRRNVARLNADGSLDQSFDPDASAPVRALVIEPDGRILIGGDFTTLRPNGAPSAATRNRIARLNADGTIDDGFDPNLDARLQPQVYAMVRQSDGRIVVGGSFTSARPNGAAVASTRNYLARFNSDGSLDLSYEPHPNGFVLSLALHVDDKLIVGGGFTSFWEAGSPEPSNRLRLARLNPNGTLDSEFNMEVNNAVDALAVQRDGKIIVGGAFTTFKNVAEEGVANRTYLGRLNPDGTVDSEFYPLVNGSVGRIVVTSDGGFLVGGNFTAAWSRGTTIKTRNYVARFHPDGTLDNAFDPGVNSTVSAFALQPDGKFVLGGYFTRVQPVGAAAGVVRNHVARFNRNGTLDTDFQLDDGGRVLTSVVQTDGKIIIAGSFTNIGGVKHNSVARLNTDGSVDHSYAPDFNGRVYTLAYEASSGKVIAGGAFTEVGGETRNYIARLNPIGTIDSEFNPNINGQVGVVLLQPDGKILVGGSFSSVLPIGYTEAITRSNLLRLNNDGSLDTGFDPYPNSNVTALALQPDNRIMVAGQFTTFTPGYTANNSASAIAQSYLARLKSDGTVDTDFKPVINSQVSAIVLQADGKVIIAGAFTTVTGSDGKLVTQANADGTTSDVAPTRNRLARLEADGKLDFSYDPNANNNVLALALQSDGKLIIGGTFTTLQPNGSSTWTLRKYAARLNPDGRLDESFNLDVSEEPGNRVDSLKSFSDGRLLVGGRFTSLQPTGSAKRVLRENFVQLDPSGLVDTTFNPGVSGGTGGVIHALTVQPDDKVVAAGNFSDLGGARTTNLARFRAEGSPDSAFGTTLAADGPVNTVIVRPISAAAASQLSGFAWLERSGALRTTFAPTGPARFSGQIRASTRERNGSLLIGGAFSDLSNNYTGNLARFRPNGTLDTSFQPVVNGLVSGIVVQEDGRIVIVGSFTTVNGVPRNYIARIDPDGSLDVTFDPAANASINAVAVQADGKIVVGGTFTTFFLNSTDDDTDDEDSDGEYDDDDDDDDDDNVSRSYLARINPDGTIDKDYYPTPNAVVNALALQADGKVLAGGTFTSLQPNGGETSFGRNYIARINLDGTLDQNFDPSANSSVLALVVEPDGQIVVGGEFTTFQPFIGDSTIKRSGVARLNSDSTVDLHFDPKANGAVRTLALQSDGALLLGGSFTTLQPNDSDEAVTRNYLARVNADGTLDLEFNPDVDAVVYALVALPDGSALVGGMFTGLQPNGALIIGGRFSTLGGIEVRNLAMLSDRASVNSSFRPHPNGEVNALLALPDGRFIAGGAFTSVAGVPRNRLVRFEADGAVDVAFNPNAGGTVMTLALQPDGKLLVGGSFDAMGGQARSNLARLNPDGSVDATFSGNAIGPVTALAIRSDLKVLYVASSSGGRSTLGLLNPDGTGAAASLTTSSGAIRAVTQQADGRIVVSGTFSGLGGAAVSRLVRLNGDFTVDATFAPAPDGAVTALALQSDGRLMVGGNFSNVGGQTRYGLARLSASSSAIQSLNVAADRHSVVWNRTGTVGDVAAVMFEVSSDGQNWSTLGVGTRLVSTGNWQLLGLSLSTSGSFYIRARGITPTSAGVASGLYEVVGEFNFDSGVRASLNDGSPAAAATIPTKSVSREVAQRAAGPAASVARSESEAAAIPATTAAVATSRLSNIAAQARVTSEDPLVVGFSISGSAPRAVLLRAVGPGLATLGVEGVLDAPQLQLYDRAGTLLTAHAGWAGSELLYAAFAQTGAFALRAGSADAAALVTLPPGTYSLRVSAAKDASGIVLAEVYDAAPSDQPGFGQLFNLSSRGVVSSGNAFVTGFVFTGNVARRLLVRGLGPALIESGVTHALADPVVAIYDSQGTRVPTAIDWTADGTGASALTMQSGAFALDASSKDAALTVKIESGAYTVRITGASGGTGVAQMEICELP